MWCGRKDRFLLDVNGQLEAYDAGVKSATIAVSSSWPVQCSADGQHLVYVDTRMGYVTKVDIASGASRWLASYDVPQIGLVRLSFSADLQSVASSKPLHLTADAGDLKTIVVRDSREVDGANVVNDIRWSEDSSKLLVVYSGAIELLDANGAKIGSWQKSKRTYFREAWFDADRQALIVFLKFDTDELGPGLTVKCRVVGWKCDRLGSRVDSASLGGRGILGTVSPLGKTEIPYNDVILIYPRYAVELRYPTSELFARQVYLTATGRNTFGINVSPTGRTAVVTWQSKPTTECRPPRPESSYCEQGMIVDLSKVLK